MKTHLITFALLFLSTILFCQIEDNPPLTLGNKKATYAVVIGISEYADEERTDLKYAHRDAAIFVDYLRSKTGGEVPEENIRLLTNEAATLAAAEDALYWLLKQVKQGERAIIYFSGHGDVETDAPGALGYLLMHDTPFNNYLFTALEIEKLNKVIVQLSVKNDAEVIVITDACHSGKLAGNIHQGSALTAEQLIKQASNEVRIMSCKPNQKSLEGIHWGGGRGAFSYHFINGLYGLAEEEEEKDLQVSLDEINIYVRKKFREDVKNEIIDRNKNQKQSPQIIGNEEFTIARVVPEDLAEWKKQLELFDNIDLESSPALAVKGAAEVNSRFRTIKNFENLLLKILAWELEEQEDLLAFFEDNEELITPIFSEQELAAFYENSSQSETVNIEGLSVFLEKFIIDKSLPESTKNQLAIACANVVQIAINDYLKGSNEELKKRYYGKWKEQYIHLPLLLETAMKLLPKEHLLQADFKVKLLYFRGLQTRFSVLDEASFESLFKEAINYQRAALEINNEIPYVHNELGILYQGIGNKSQAEFHYRQAIKWSPTWILPKTNLAGLLTQQGDLTQSGKILTLVVQAEPNHSEAYTNLGKLFEKTADYLLIEENFQRAAQLNNYDYLPMEKLGFFYTKIGDFEKANDYFIESEKRKIGISPHRLLGDSEDNIILHGLSEDLIDYSGIENELLLQLAKDSNNVDAHFGLGEVYKDRKELEKAEFHYKKVIDLDPEHLCVYRKLGALFFNQKRLEEAEISYQKQLVLSPNDYSFYFKLGSFYEYWNRFESAEGLYLTAIEAINDWTEDTIAIASASCPNLLHSIQVETNPNTILHQAYGHLVHLYTLTNRYREAENMLTRIKDKFNMSDWKLLSFYTDRINEFPDFSYWYYQKALLKYEAFQKNKPMENGFTTISDEKVETFDEYEDQSITEELFKKVLALEKNHPDRFDIHFKIGDLYFHKDSLYTAAYHLEQAIAGTPDRIDRVFYLVDVYLKNYQLTAALTKLDSLHQNNQLSFDKNVAYAQLLMKSKQFPKSEKIMLRADSISLIPLPIIAEELAKLYHLNDQFEIAEKWYQTAITRAADNPNYDYGIARQYATKGEKEVAFVWLEKALKKGFDLKWVLKYDPELVEIRGENTFENLMNQYEVMKEED